MSLFRKTTEQKIAKARKDLARTEDRLAKASATYAKHVAQRFPRRDPEALRAEGDQVRALETTRDSLRRTIDDLEAGR